MNMKAGYEDPMEGTVKTSRMAMAITLTVAIHLVAVIIHALAHARLAVNMTPLQNLYIVVVIMIAPVIAGILVWTPFHRAGAYLFAIAMMGALIFGGYHHFIAAGVDHITRVPVDGWGAFFRFTAVALALIEAWGCGLVLWWQGRRFIG